MTLKHFIGTELVLVVGMFMVISAIIFVAPWLALIYILRCIENKL